MRLRRENGDFNIVIDNEIGTCTIPKNLFPEQLVGQIVVIRVNGKNVHMVITAVEGVNGDDIYHLIVITNSGTPAAFTYTVATGAVAIIQG